MAGPAAGGTGAGGTVATLRFGRVGTTCQGTRLQAKLGLQSLRANQVEQLAARERAPACNCWTCASACKRTGVAAQVLYDAADALHAQGHH